jgi:excinuclease ABC subunit A
MGLDAKRITSKCSVCWASKCSVCWGSGTVRTDMEFLPDIYTECETPDIYTECETCRGTGYTQEAWDIKHLGYSLPELNDLTLEEVYGLFKDYDRIASPLKAALDVGLGYLLLHQPGHTMSGGEAQRLRIAAELSKKRKSKKRKGETLYILDEPTIGQHMEDIERLKGVLHRLVDEGNSVLVVEHHPSILASCAGEISGTPTSPYILKEMGL